MTLADENARLTREVAALSRRLDKTKDAVRRLEAAREALRADKSRLTFDCHKLRAENDELRRRLGGGCDASPDGQHQPITQGSYAFCAACGESLRGVRFVHMERAKARKEEAE